MNCPKCGAECPDDARFCGWCGASLTAEMRGSEAFADMVTELRTHLNKHPEDHNARYNLAIGWMYLGQYAQAAEALETVVAAMADYTDARERLATCYLRLGRKADAVSQLRAALAQDASRSHIRGLLERLEQGG